MHRSARKRRRPPAPTPTTRPPLQTHTLKTHARHTRTHTTHNRECATVFKGKKIEKGIAFPTCVAPNAVVGHFSPLEGDATALKDGDLVKM